VPGTASRFRQPQLAAPSSKAEASRARVCASGLSGR
jgi:hypothetical protein